MGKINVTTTIPASPDRVFDTIVDPSTYDQWMTIHTKWKGDVPERYTKGAKADEVVTMLGMANTISWTVEDMQEPSLLKIAGTGMAGVRTTFSLGVEPEGDGAKTTIEAEFEGQMVVGALGKAIEKDAQQNLEASLEKLSALVS